MKKFFFLIPILFIVACSEQKIFFSGSVGTYPYPDPDKIFWAFLEYPPPDFGFVENATVLLDSITRISFNGERGGYYKDGIISLNYNSLHTVQVEVEDYQNIYAETTIPSSFEFDMVDAIREGDALTIMWTHAESLETSPDQWRMAVLMGGDTLHHIGISRTINKYIIISGVITADIEIIMDAIKFGDISGAKGNSVFAGVARKRKNVTLINDSF